MEYGTKLPQTILTNLDGHTTDQKYELLNDSDFIKANGSHVPFGKSKPGSDAHIRLQEAIRLSTFRSEGDGKGDGQDTVTEASEKDSLVTNRKKRKKLSEEAAEKYRVGILVVSWVSMGVLGVLGVLTFVIAVRENSNASFAFGMDALLVCLSSIVIIWRYTIIGGKANTFSVKKEKLSCLFLGVLFYISATAVIIRCLMSLIHADTPEASSLLWKIFVVNCLCCTVFAILELFLALGLESVSVAMDGINTGIAALLSLSACVNDVIYIKKGVAIWYIDSVIGIACGIAMITLP